MIGTLTKNFLSCEAFLTTWKLVCKSNKDDLNKNLVYLHF